MRLVAFLIALTAGSACGQVQIVSLDRIDADHMPTAASKSTVCECGCLDGGVCTCPDCPHHKPTLVASRTKLLPDGSPDTLAPGIAGLFNVVDTPPAYTTPPKKYAPPPKYAPAPTTARQQAVTYEQYSFGSCANGSCGPARSYGRFRLFGRRR